MFWHRSIRALASLGVILSLALTAMAGPASVLAAPKDRPVPTVVATPGQVAPGNAVRFDVSLTNSTPSNYSQFFLDGVASLDPSASEDADYLGTLEGPTIAPAGGVPAPAGQCTQGDSVNLECSFGALPSGATVALAVWYATPEDFSGTFSVNFIFTSTGTPSDPKGRSHGDDFATVGSAVVSSNNFDGGYFLTPVTIQTNQTLSRQNPQSTKIPSVGAFDGGPLTAQEVNFSNELPCPQAVLDDDGSCFGQWSIINVDGGTLYPGGFEVIVGLDNSITPGQTNAIKFVHVKDDGTVELISQTCNDTSGAAPTNLPCRYFTSSMGDSYAHIWLLLNGRLGGY
jgi:hypothetical protein